MRYTKVITVKITPIQKQTLNKLADRNIRVSNFIREAIKEKIQREASHLKQPQPDPDVPF